MFPSGFRMSPHLRRCVRDLEKVGFYKSMRMRFPFVPAIKLDPWTESKRHVAVSFCSDIEWNYFQIIQQSERGERSGSSLCPATRGTDFITELFKELYGSDLWCVAYKTPQESTEHN